MTLLAGRPAAPAPKATAPKAAAPTVVTGHRLAGGTPRSFATPPKAAPAPPPVTSYVSGHHLASGPRSFATLPKAAPKGSTKGLTGNFGGAAVKDPFLAKSEALAAAIPKNAGGILATLGNQLINLPESTLIGVESLGKAIGGDAIQGLEHPLSGFSPITSSSRTTKLLQGAIKSDPIYKAVTQGSLDPLAKDPLGTLLDLSAGYGVVGKGLGAVARSGAVGEGLQRAAALGGRESLVAAPGAAGTEIARGYSPNLFTKAIQASADRMGSKAPLAIQGAQAEHSLRLETAASHTAEAGVYAADRGHVIKTLQAVKPKGKEEQAIAPLVAFTGQNRAGLERLYHNMLKEPAPKDPDTLASRHQVLDSLSSMIAKDNAGKFNWAETNRAAAAYHTLSQMVEAQKAAHNIMSIDQMDRALDVRRMVNVEPDVHYLDKPTKNPVLTQLVKEAKGETKTARGLLQGAQDRRSAYLGTPDQRGAYGGASNALAQVRESIPVNPVTDTLMNKVLDLRQILDESHPDLKAFHDANVALQKQQLSDALDREAAARGAEQSQKLLGPMIEDPNMPPLRSGPLKGMRVRPVTAEDVAARRANDPAFQSYVSAKNPERLATPSLQHALKPKGRTEIASVAEKGRVPYKGEALLAGDLRAGWSALPHTLLRDLSNIHVARENSAFADRFAIANDEGLTHFTTPAEAKLAAHDYQARTGIRVTPVQDNGVVRLLPQSAIKELNRQRALDNPTAFGKLLTTPNRIFRKTVLPYSPKLPVMHQVENVSRVAAMERGNLLRAIPDYARGKAILNAAGPADRARLESLITPGSLTRSGAGGELEDLGHLPVDRSVPASAVHAVTGTLDELGTQIIRVQRAMEHSAQITALGAHARTLLQESGVSWAEANTAVRKYADDLANQLATPAEAERAARAVHVALGKYNAFTANTRLAMRAMPFGSWYMNAARLIFVTLPKDHPLFSALVHDVNQAVAPQWAKQHAGLPGDLQTAANVGPNAWLDVGKLTPIGLPNEGPLAMGSQLVMPWASSAALALAGKDPFMADLKGPDTAFGSSASPSGVQSGGAGTRQAALSAIEQLVESLGGPLSDVSRAVYAHGGTLYNTDAPAVHLLTGGQVGSVAVKPGTEKNAEGLLAKAGLSRALDKVLDPFHPTTYHVRNSGGSTNLGLGKPEGHLGGAAGGTLGKPEGHL